MSTPDIAAALETLNEFRGFNPKYDAALDTIEAHIAAADLLHDLDSSSLANYLARAEAAERERDEALQIQAGFISPVQKVLEERRRAEALEREVAEWKADGSQWCDRYVTERKRAEALEAALREIARVDSPFGHSHGIFRDIARRALEEPYADVPGAGQRGC